MFSDIRRFFLVALVMLAGTVLAPAAIAQVDANETEAAKRVAGQFVKAMREGRQDVAADLVSATARDELQTRFAPDGKTLRSKPEPRFMFALPLRSHSLDPVEYEANMVFAASNDGKWNTVMVRLYRYDRDPYRVEYWQIEDREPNLFALSDDPVLQKMPTIMRALSLGMALFGAVLLALIIWLVRRKPRLVVPEPAERRVAAIARREDGAAD